MKSNLKKQAGFVMFVPLLIFAILGSFTAGAVVVDAHNNKQQQQQAADNSK